MKQKTAIRLSAWFDGELPDSQREEIESLLQRDPEARAYVAGLQQTRDALGGAHVGEVQGGAAWESFRDQLEQPLADPATLVLAFPRFALAAAAAIVIVGMGLWFPLRKMGDTSQTVGLESMVYMVETELENATPIVYIDEPSGWTVVWVVEQELPEQG